MVRWDRRQFGRGAVWQPQAWEEIKMFKVIRDGKVHEFSELHEMQKYINRSKRWGGEYVFTFDMLNIEDETWEISSSEAWDDICWMAERNGDIKVLVEYPEIETKTVVRMVDGHEVPAGEVVGGLDSAWKSGEQVVAEAKEIYKQVQEKKKDVEKAATDTQQEDDFVAEFGKKPETFHINVAGADFNYDSSEPCGWFGGRGNTLHTGFNEVMSGIKFKTSHGWLLYRVKDCHCGSLVMGAGNNTKAWRVDRRNPKKVFEVLAKVKEWLTEHGELAA